MGRLSEKVAIITGAGNGMGAVTAHIFAKEGAKVIATDILLEPLEKVVNTINKEFGDVSIAVEHNVTDEANWANVLKQGVEHFGKIDVLVNNAGIGAQAGSIDGYPLDEWNKVMGVNSTGMFLGIRCVAPEMKKANGGSIINISSLAAMLSLPTATAPYVASKGAIRSLTKVAANDLAAYKIRVNSVHPGFILTELVKTYVDEKLRNEIIENHIPLGKMGDPEDIAYLLVFLASEESKFMTGAEVVIDGGHSIR